MYKKYLVRIPAFNFFCYIYASGIAGLDIELLRTEGFFEELNSFLVIYIFYSGEIYVT